MEMDKERKTRLEKMSYNTAKVGPGDRGRKKSKKRNGFDYYLFGFNLEFSKTRNELARPVWEPFF